jgi:hypothetical protein
MYNLNDLVHTYCTDDKSKCELKFLLNSNQCFIEYLAIIIYFKSNQPWSMDPSVYGYESIT